MRPLHLLLLLALTFAATSATSAEAQPPDVAAARGRAARAIDCVARLHRTLGTQLQLLREAQAQLNVSDTELREAAAHTVQSIEQRIDDLGEQLRACVPRSARLETQVRVEEHSGAEAAVGQENAHTQRVEANAALTQYVHVQVGERVDGHGQLPATTVRQMVHGIGARLGQCYDHLAERSSLERGTLVLSFTVDGRGRVQRVRVEAQHIGDSNFNRCVRHAGQRMRAGASPSGGDVRYAYTLRFGPAR